MTQRQTLYSRILVIFAGLQIFTIAAFAQVEVEIKVDSDARTAEVAGRFVEGFRPANEAHLTFKGKVSGFPDLASRISTVALFDQAGEPVEARKLMDGEYVLAGKYQSWKYSVDLTPPKDRAAYAHASWLSDAAGILMYDDLLPQFASENVRPPGHKVLLKLPQTWKASFTLNEDLSRSVVYIGEKNRVVDVKAEAGNLQLVLAGDWHFTDEEAAGMAREIFDEYSKLLGNLPKQEYMISVLRFPTQDSPGHWEAETRGRTVTIMSSDMPFRTQSVQRLHEQLRHEIFHLWFPNGVKLTGDYAWFYEGFAMYSSLKLAVKLNRIRFEDFLDTLARAHTIDSNSRPRQPLTESGIDPTVRYARGMVIAFLTDLEILRNSGGKQDVGIRLQGLFERHRTGKAEASDAVRTVIASYAFQRFVAGTEMIEWAADLSAAGIESRQNGRSTTLTVAQRPDGRQKRMLDRLGYNNWRKLGSKK